MTKKINEIKLEFLNFFSHGLGVIFGILALIILLFYAIKDGDTLKIVAFSLYGASFTMLFFISSAYHIVKNESIKKGLKVLDHCSIFYFIAGSYTPLILLLFEGNRRIFFISLIWGIAIVGTIFEILRIRKNNLQMISLALYLAMGWISVFMIKPIYHHSKEVFWFIVVGGLLYTIGTYFYKNKKLIYGHFIWHIFVLVAAVTQFFGIFSLA